MEVSFREPVRHITTQMLDMPKQLEAKVDMERDHALAVTNQVSILKISNLQLFPSYAFFFFFQMDGT